LTGLYENTAQEEDYSNEPPLLEELDINFDHILGKTKAVLRPFKNTNNLDQPDELLMDSDLTGPIFFLVCLGCCLLLQGKVQFGSIYGFGVFGCVALFALLNLLSPPAAPPIDFWQVVSTLGYCLLPVVLVAIVGIIVNLTGIFGNILSAVAIVWCTYTATRNFERLLNMNKQRFLIAYPIGLLYSIFVLITIF
jgi:protein YIPF5/7